MVFCALNGYTIPTKQGGNPITTEFVDRDEAWDGTRRLDVISRKRDLELTTVTKDELTSEALRGVILGLGQLFHFDADEYSTKGLYTSQAAAYEIESSTGADGDSVYTSWRTGASSYVFATQTKYGVGCLGAYDTATNLLTADQRDCENGTTGFSPIGGTSAIASDSSNYWQQTKSIKITSLATYDGIQFTPDYNPGVGSDGKTYTGSVYVKGDSGGEQVELVLHDVTNVVSTTATYTLTNADTWYRLQVTHTISGGDCSALDIWTRSSNGAMVFYVDGFQLEENPHMTSWVDGTRGSNTSLKYSTSDFNGDVTFNFWTLGPPYLHSGYALVVTIYKDINDRIQVYSVLGAGTNYVLIASQVGGVVYTLTHNDLWDGTWKMVTCVVRRNPEVGESNARIYVDGVSVENGDLTAYSSETFSLLEIGNFTNTSDYPCGLLDDVMVLPYAATSAQVLGWFNMGKAMSDLPYNYLTGDCIPEDQREVLGELKGSAYVGFSDSGTWRSNAVEHRFTLREK